MIVPKKVLLHKKKRIRKNTWKRKGYGTTLKSFYLGKSLFFQEFKKIFCANKKVIKR